MALADGPDIDIDNIGLARGEGALFSGLSLQLRERRIGLIGNNGSGKSSLLRLINGLLLPDTGTIRVCGLDTRRDRAALPGVAGFLFQNPDHQIVYPVVAEEIAFGLRESGHSANAARDSVLQILAAHGHQDWADRPIHELSDGQKQLVCILAVTITQPRFLLLDEPFSSLDLPTRWDMMRRLDALPQSIIMASHDFDLLTQFDRIIWLDKGVVRADGAAAATIAAYRAACRPAEPRLMQSAQ